MLLHCGGRRGRRKERRTEEGRVERWRTEKEGRERGRGETEMERQRKRERERWGKSERVRGKSVHDVINQLANGTYYGVRPRDSLYRRQIDAGGTTRGKAPVPSQRTKGIRVGFKTDRKCQVKSPASVALMPAQASLSGRRLSLAETGLEENKKRKFLRVYIC